MTNIARLVIAGEAVRDSDALVAEKVMGWTRLHERCFRDGTHLRGSPPDYPSIVHDVPSYSTDIAAAWEVVERMQAYGWDMTLLRLMDGHLCRFNDMEGRYREARVDPREGNAALAICRAALAAVHPTEEGR